MESLTWTPWDEEVERQGVESGGGGGDTEGSDLSRH